MKTKILTVILAITMLSFSFSANASKVIQTSDGDVNYTVAEKPVLTTNAKSAVLIDGLNGEILYEENKDEQLPFASITKVMTMLLTVEAIEKGNLKLDDILVCSEHAKSMGGSEIWLEVGEKMSVNDLLKAVAVNSANDAAVVLAEAIGGSDDNFVAMMNKRANELGMKNTCFKNTNGLPEEGHYSSAYDIAVMSKELMKHKLILNFTTIWTDSLRDGKTELANTNKLIRFYSGATGLKTGFTDDSGYCLTATAERDELPLIAVVLGCETSDRRFNGAKELLNYGFSAYTVVSPEINLSQIDETKIILGTKEKIKAVLPKIEGLVLKKDEKEKLTYDIEIVKNVSAPVEKGQTLGKINFKIDGKTIKSYNLTAEETVEKLSFFKSFCALLLKFIFMR